MSRSDGDVVRVIAPPRGVKQGCVLSPAFFVLYEACASDEWPDRVRHVLGEFFKRYVRSVSCSQKASRFGLAHTGKR